MNQAFLESLPEDDREQICEWYVQLQEKEITLPYFVSRVRELVGQEGLSFLLGEEQEIKPDQLHDVIQYAGVDLKEEQENIVKQTETELGEDLTSEDYYNSIESLLNVKMFVEFIHKITKNRNFTINEEGIYAAFLVLKRRLQDFIEDIIEASKVRVDSRRCNVEVINDIKRQLWCLEQNEQKLMDSLKIKRDDDDKKKVKSKVQEREDLLIKKRMSNSIALAALGGSQKLWMHNEPGIMKETETPFQSLYSPFDDKEHERKVKERTLTMQDFLFVLERDKRYNKSIITIHQYFGVDFHRNG